jgi:cyclopropane fatty-acyl-phospholipid synthase-like methyltransferase
VISKSFLQFIKKKVIKTLYTKLFPSWEEELKREFSNSSTVLDLGCGYNSPISHCEISFSVGVELFEPYLRESKKKSIHNQYIKADVREIKFEPNSFDVILCLEVLEHLTKEEGYELIGRMEKWTKEKIIIIGFRIYGMGGWKKLRGYKGSVKYKPTRLWSVISDLTQKITYYFPKFAFQLFAVKQIDKK